MSVPRTYLLTAPSDLTDTFGKGLSSHTLTTRLKKMNPAVWVECEYEGDLRGIWSPSRDLKMTCIWFGPTADKTRSKKISAYKTGMIPEFTQIDVDGSIAHLGWRRILEKAILRRAVRQIDVERLFGVTLDVVNKADGWCPDCMKTGKQVRATGSRNLCNFHTQLVITNEKATQHRRDEEWLRRKLSCQLLPSKAKSSQTDSQTKLVSM